MTAEGITHLQAQQLWQQQQHGGGASADGIIDLGTVTLKQPFRRGLQAPTALTGVGRTAYFMKGRCPAGALFSKLVVALPKRIGPDTLKRRRASIFEKITLPVGFSP